MGVFSEDNKVRWVGGAVHLLFFPFFFASMCFRSLHRLLSREVAFFYTCNMYIFFCPPHTT